MAQELVRSFLAVEVSDLVRQKVDQYVGTLKQSISGVRWVAPQNVHITLRFYGDLDATQVELLSTGLETVASRTQPFTLTAQGLGAFPNPNRARVIWFGLKGQLDTLHQLDAAVRQLSHDLDLPGDDKPFRPHVTIGRVRKGRRIGGLAPWIETQVELGIWEVQQLTLFRSDLHPSGPRYTPLGIFPLRD